MTETDALTVLFGVSAPDKDSILHPLNPALKTSPLPPLPIDRWLREVRRRRKVPPRESGGWYGSYGDDELARAARREIVAALLFAQRCRKDEFGDMGVLRQRIGRIPLRERAQRVKAEIPTARTIAKKVRRLVDSGALEAMFPLNPRYGALRPRSDMDRVEEVVETARTAAAALEALAGVMDTEAKRLAPRGAPGDVFDPAFALGMGFFYFHLFARVPNRKTKLFTSLIAAAYESLDGDSRKNWERPARTACDHVKQWPYPDGWNRAMNVIAMNPHVKKGDAKNNGSPHNPVP
ncbi:MAG: hypothetical protein K8F62_14475 [Pseudorhodoplanes sp.]|nr:hypothetical protein [Pseudorhodoplanes sp.]